MKKTILCTALALIALLPAFGQSLSTDIFLFDIAPQQSGYRISKPINITRHEGYDNQPEFSADSHKIYYVSATDTNQTDLMVYEIATGKSRHLSHSRESEFSPKLTSKSDQISVVRIDNDHFQRLYSYSITDSSAKLLSGSNDSVAYYCWLSDSVVAMACLNGKMDLYLCNVKSNTSRLVAGNVGRTLLKIPSTSDLLFTVPEDSGFVLKKFDTHSGETAVFAPRLFETADFAFTPDGELLGGHQGKLYRYTASEGNWKLMADLQSEIGLFYRLAVSPDGKKIAVVSYSGKRP
ncbi:MAG TPA: hypothetical protein VFW78_11370 [Bacteroidia bacterium]|nr:hypothetical protein [Bacteroidia bacterium]